MKWDFKPRKHILIWNESLIFYFALIITCFLYLKTFCYFSFVTNRIAKTFTNLSLLFKSNCWSQINYISISHYFFNIESNYSRWVWAPNPKWRNIFSKRLKEVKLQHKKGGYKRSFSLTVRQTKFYLWLPESMRGSGAALNNVPPLVYSGTSWRTRGCQSIKHKDIYGFVKSRS